MSLFERAGSIFKILLRLLFENVLDSIIESDKFDT